MCRRKVETKKPLILADQYGPVDPIRTKSVFIRGLNMGVLALGMVSPAGIELEALARRLSRAPKS